ncbi:MAG: VanW family protein [Intestinibacter sp.]|uniref:VanW family protein n=1 Tax=Intestinibacter sp. TaxID=1965304 RepID=UPI003F17E085
MRILLITIKEGMTALKRLGLLVILVIVFIIGKADIVDAFNFNEKIYKNVYIDNIDLSGLTREEAKKKVNSYIEENRCFVLIYKNQEIIIDKSKFDVDYKVDNLVEQAYKVGRNEDIISNIKTRVSLQRGDKKVIPFDCSYSISKIDRLIDDLNSKIYVAPVNATAEISNGEIIVTEDSYGQTIDKNKLKKIIIYKIEKLNCEKVEIPIKTIAPKYTYSQLKKINTLLGTYETYFNPNNTNRVDNINVAANSTSNIIVNTDEKFSFNNILESTGARSKLKNAPIILNGKPGRGLGGGICQVSTTIYNAALYAGMDIVDVTNHSIPSLYANKGRDATVSYGYIDFVFQNKNKTPIIIYNQVFKGRIVSSIYGNAEDKKNIEIKTEVVKVIKNKKVYKQDSSIQKGTEVVEQEGKLGYTVNTFRLYKLDGEVLKKELINTSYYPPRDEIIKINK